MSGGNKSLNMDGFWSSLSKWFSEKTGSPLYFTYIGFFIVWNWKFFQIVLLESASLFRAPRIEYINSELWFFVPALSAVPVWANVIIDWIINLIWHIGPPIFFTYLAIVYLPILQKWALNKYLESRFERKKIFEEKQREYDNWLLEQEKKHKKTLENIVTVKEQKAKVEKEIEKIMTEEEHWELEYLEFEKSPYFYEFKQIIETIYKYEGVIEITVGFQKVRHADANSLATAHTRDLISYFKDSHNVIEFTKKGKMFAKLYLNKYTI